MGDGSRQAAREVVHGLTLAAGETEHTWGWGTAAGRRRAQRRGALIVGGAGLAPGMRVLELGCGTGLFTEIFARTGVQLVAIDISRALLEKARARRLSTEQVQFVEGPLEESPIAGPFDAVVGSSVLHHLDLRRALSRVHDLLVPGGRVCFAEPNMLNPQVFLERRFRRWFPYVSPDETAFVRWQLRRHLAEAGFGEISLRPFDWLHPRVPSSLVPVVEWTGRTLERIPGMREFAGSLLIRCCRSGRGS